MVLGLGFIIPLFLTTILQKSIVLLKEKLCFLCKISLKISRYLDLFWDLFWTYFGPVLAPPGVISFSWFSMLLLKSNSVTKPIKEILDATMHMKVFPITGKCYVWPSSCCLELLSRVFSFSWFSMLLLKSNSVTKPIKEILEATMHMKVFPITGKCYIWPSSCCLVS